MTRYGHDDSALKPRFGTIKIPLYSGIKVFMVFVLLLLGVGFSRGQQLLLSDDFDSGSTSAAGFNSTLGADESGLVAPVNYTVTTGGNDYDAQHGNGGAMLLVGNTGYGSTVSLNYNFATLANLANSPLKIRFDGWVDGTTNASCWFSFAIGSAQNINVLSSSAKFAINPTLNGGGNVWSNGVAIGNLSLSVSNYTVVLANTAGTGSAFNGSGSVASLYNGSTLLGTYTLSQLGNGDGYISFAANPYNGSWNLAHIDNLSISNCSGTLPTCLLSDNFGSANTSAAAFNLTVTTDQGGLVAPTSYAITTGGNDYDAQHGNGGAMLLVGTTSYGATASLNRNFASLANAANSPLQIQFNGYVDSTAVSYCWFSFVIGSAQNINILSSSAKFGINPTLNGGGAVWSAGSSIGSLSLSVSNYTIVLANTAGTGSAFNGHGSVAKLYNGTILVGTYTLSQLGSGDGYISFGADPYDSSSDLAHIGSLSITNLTGTIATRFLTWTGVVEANWNTTQTNWSGGVGWDNVYDNAIFGATAPGTVMLTEAITAQSITFNAAGYTLTGGSLALTGPQAITNNADAVIGSPIDASALNKFGTGTLTLGGSNLYLGTLSVKAGAVSLAGPFLDGCTMVSLAAGTRLNLNFTGTNAIASLTINGTNLPTGIYNAKHPVYGSYFAGSGSLGILPLTYQLAGGNATWPPGMRATIVASMNEAVAVYNAYDYFPMHILADYNAGVATAEASYGGPAIFGPAYNDAFVAIHEIQHCLGTGTYWNWAYQQSNGQWTGAHALQRIHLYDGTNAVLNCDTAHFWPYGLNYETEDSPTNRYRHVKMVAALRWDMGLVADSNNDGVPDDWDMFWFGTLTPNLTGINDLAAYLADIPPVSSVSLASTNVTASVSGKNLTISWPADHTGWTLLVQTNHLDRGVSGNTNDWMRVAGSTGTNLTTLPVNPVQASAFYRLVYP